MEQLKQDLQKNQAERMKFVEYWAEYVRTHPDKDWGKQQAILINSQLSNKYPLTREEYLKMKNQQSSINSIILAYKSVLK